ncbi:MAG: hypothetical protein H6835_21215, partial [Planctomycetes bacterium]|nr:hypothetical protein [Planctomycetota bacterium]
ARVADGVAEAAGMRSSLAELDHLGGEPARQQVQQLRERLEQNARFVTEARTALSRAQHQLADCEAMLTQVLELLPTTELQLQRAESRVKGLEGATREVRKRLSQLEEDGAARRSKELELYEIDLTVLRQQLIEVKGQLARLVPVRYELLRQR